MAWKARVVGYEPDDGNGPLIKVGFWNTDVVTSPTQDSEYAALKLYPGDAYTDSAALIQDVKSYGQQLRTRASRSAQVRAAVPVGAEIIIT
jgi:hypothetical protein